MLKSNLISIPLFIVTLAIFPLFFNNSYSLITLNQMGIAIIFAISYNQLLGKAGLLSLGHAVYFGFGGFFTVHVITQITAGNVWLPLYLLPLVGGAAGLLMAAIFGSFTTRRGGIMFAMLSFAIAELVLSSATVFGRFYGGSLDRTTLPTFPFTSFQSDTSIYYVIVAWIAVVITLVHWFNSTPLGCLIEAAGQNPERIAYTGYSNHRLKFQAFSFAGFLAGIGGALFALTYEFVTVEIISLKQSWLILQMVFIGGVGYFWGPPLGAILLTVLFSQLSVITDLGTLYIGLAFMAIVLFSPNGVAGLTVDLLRQIKKNGMGALLQNHAEQIFASAMMIIGFIGLCEFVHHLRDDQVWQMIRITSPLMICLPLFAGLLMTGLWLLRRKRTLSYS